MKKIGKHLRRTPHLRLYYPKLDIRSLYIVTYRDSSFRNNDDFTSQLRYKILLADIHKKCSAVHYSSHKYHRVARLSMAAETLAFTDGFDNAFPIKHDMQRMLGKELTLLVITESKILCNVVTIQRSTTEKGS